ncbi:hypothetical protein HDU76_003074, partial [Blyttiomyces sp. JEL0837]
KKKQGKKRKVNPLVQLPDNFPEPLVRLHHLFKCINTVYSFMAVQRQVVCTFDTLKSGVDSLLGKPRATDTASNNGPSTQKLDGDEMDLEVDEEEEDESNPRPTCLRLLDIGAVRVLLPDALDLFWAERSQLVDATLSELSTGQVTNKTPALGDDTYALVVEFKDCKPVKLNGGKSVVDEKGRPYGPKHVSLVKQAQLVSGMTTLPRTIQGRERRFVESLVKFHEEAFLRDENAWQSLKELALAAVPAEPGLKIKPDPSPAAIAVLRNGASLSNILDNLQNESFYIDQIPAGGWKTNDARLPIYGNLDRPLSAELQQALFQCSNIKQFYVHQAKAINDIDAGRHVIISTSTSSGKSLIYQVPMLKELERNPQAKAIYIFPTKALAQDQKRSLVDILSFCPHLAHVQVDTYDGDTGWEGSERERIRATASVIFTNPDMLHVSVLPQHAKWKDFLLKLRFVIVDELHYYSGRFGTNCAMVMRRLRRICSHYGNENVQFISCSATIANPIEHMETFFGINEVSLVDEDGSPCGRKHHILWNPPLRNSKDPRQGRSSFLEEGVLVRRMCELLLRELQAHLREGDLPDLADMVMSYRGGYSPEERREIEAKMFRGQLLGIVATNALELGVDIGSLGTIILISSVNSLSYMTLLDAVVHLGFPFNIASYRQQSGRAGRREKDSVSIMVCDGDNMLDQYYIANPTRLFAGSLDTIRIDSTNDLILESHLQCTAAEFPILPEDLEIWFGRSSEAGQIVKKTKEELELEETRLSPLELGKQFLLWDPKFGVFFAARRYNGEPAKSFPIRAIDDQEAFRVIDVTTNKDIEDVEAERAPFTLYEGSVLIHQGQSYVVFEVNVDRRYAKVRPGNVDYITAVRDFTDVDPFLTLESLNVRTELHTGFECADGYPELFAHFGELRAKTTCFGYFKINPKSKKILEAVVGSESPPIIHEMSGLWMDVPPYACTFIGKFGKNVEWGIHGANHVLLSLLPNVVVIPTSGQTDLRTDCKSPLARRPRPPRLVIYEKLGSGIVHKAFKQIDNLVQSALRVIEMCQCDEGCPGCVYRSACKEANAAIDKWAAIRVLRGVLGQPMDCEL